MGNSLIKCRLENVKNITCFGKKDGLIKFRLYPENKFVPENTKCLYQLIKINPDKNKIIKDFTEIKLEDQIDGKFFVTIENLCAGTYQIGIFTQENTDEPIQIDACIGIIMEPPKLEVIMYNKKKVNRCKYIADITVIGGVKPYKYYLNCKEYKCVDHINYLNCKKNVLKVVDANGCTIKHYI